MGKYKGFLSIIWSAVVSHNTQKQLAEAESVGNPIFRHVYLTTRNGIRDALKTVVIQTTVFVAFLTITLPLIGVSISFQTLFFALGALFIFVTFASVFAFIGGTKLAAHNPVLTDPTQGNFIILDHLKMTGIVEAAWNEISHIEAVGATHAFVKREHSPKWLYDAVGFNQFELAFQSSEIRDSFLAEVRKRLKYSGN